MARGHVSILLALSLSLSGCVSVSPNASQSEPAATPTNSPAEPVPAPQSQTTESSDPEPTESTLPVADPSGESPLEFLLAELEIEPEWQSGYDRDLFNHWIDADGDGCNTRREVLIQESIQPVSLTGRCDVSGAWWSAFDGSETSNPADFDVDHMVPLKEAWDSGAHTWDSKTRTAFANDLGFAGSLIAVSASSNRSKSDRDPAQWLPVNQNFHCDYAFNWLAVKYRWTLSMDSTEALALGRLSATCTDQEFEPIPQKANVSLGAPVVQNQSPSNSSSNSIGELDPRFNTCREALASGFGEYVRGVDPEYEWYRDGDGDGIACE